MVNSCLNKYIIGIYLQMFIAGLYLQMYIIQKSLDIITD